MLSAADFPDVFPWMTERSPGPGPGIGVDQPASPAGRSAAEGAIDWLAPCPPLPAPPALVVAAMAMLRLSSTALPAQYAELASGSCPWAGSPRR